MQAGAKAVPALAYAMFDIDGKGEKIMTLSNIIIGVAVLAALLYFICRIRKLFRGTASCCGGSCSGSCSSCRPKPAEKAEKSEGTEKNRIV